MKTLRWIFRQPMIDLQVKQMADDFAMRIQQQGLSLEQYFQFTGMTAEKMMEEITAAG